MVNAFCVRSCRVNDIELDEGTTVGKLRAMLHNSGYDVLDAHAQISRAAEGDKVIGKTDAYSLKAGDCVLFDTYHFQTPNLNKGLAKLGKEQDKDDDNCEQRDDRCCEEKCGSASSCCKCGEKKARVAEADGISVTRTEDGAITIRVEC